jgi:hypothetical protein
VTTPSRLRANCTWLPCRRCAEEKLRCGLGESVTGKAKKRWAAAAAWSDRNGGAAKCAGPEVKVWRVVTEPFATPDSQYPQSLGFAQDREAERRVVQTSGVGIKYCEAMTFVHECKTARILVSLSPRAAPQQHRGHKRHSMPWPYSLRHPSHACWLTLGTWASREIRFQDWWSS